MFFIIGILAIVIFAVIGYNMPRRAFILAPAASITMAIFSGAAESEVGMVISPFIFIIAVIAISISKKESDYKQWHHILAEQILIFLGAAVIITLGFLIYWPLGIFGIIIFISFVALLISHMVTSRFSTAAFVISTIGASIRQNLPLTMALESAAGGLRDKRSRILLNIKKWLLQGYTLSESIRRGYPACPSRALAMIAATEQINQLPFALKVIEKDMIAMTDERRRIKPISTLYPFVIIFIAFLLVLGLMSFVMPQFASVLQEILEGTPMPFATRLLMDIVAFIVYDYGWLIIWPILAIAFIAFNCSFFTRFRSRRLGNPNVLSLIGDFLKWHLPVLHWFENNYSLVQTVEILRLSLNAGSSIDIAIAETLSLDTNNCFKKHLQNWLCEVQAGNDISESAKKNKLGGPLAWAFDEKINQGNTLAVLEVIESFYRSNYSYRVNLMRLAMGPLMVICTGAVVGFVVYAIFSVMVQIISLLAGMVAP